MATIVKKIKFDSVGQKYSLCIFRDSNNELNYVTTSIEKVKDSKDLTYGYVVGKINPSTYVKLEE